MSWQPSLGAWPEGEGIRFRVWAPEARSVQVVLERPGSGATHALQRSARGFWTAHITGVRPGDRYRYRVDNRGAFPDPASRFQPESPKSPPNAV